MLTKLAVSPQKVPNLLDIAVFRLASSTKTWTATLWEETYKCEKRQLRPTSNSLVAFPRSREGIARWHSPQAWCLVISGTSPLFRVYGFAFPCNSLPSRLVLSAGIKWRQAYGNTMRALWMSGRFFRDCIQCLTPSPMRCLMRCAWRVTAATHQMQDNSVYHVETEVPDRMKQLRKMNQCFFYYVYMISSSSLVMHLCRAGHPCFCLCQFARERDNHLDPGVLVGVLTWNITCKLAHVVVSLAEDGHGKGHVP